MVSPSNEMSILRGMYELLADEVGEDSSRVGRYHRRQSSGFSTRYRSPGITSTSTWRARGGSGWRGCLARQPIMPGHRGGEVRIMADGVEIFSDPLLEKVFFNLVDNTVRHGGGATTITVTFTEDTDGGILCVEDDGVRTRV